MTTALAGPPLSTEAEREAYECFGFVTVRGLLAPDEAARLYACARSDDVLTENSYELLDAEGHKTRLALWYTPGDDVYGRLSRSRRMVARAEVLLGGPVGHYHSKVMQKAPRTGGAWEWHQDYGYWYKNGFLFPRMLSVMVALTESVQANGCLQVLPGSHHLGRLNHVSIGEQVAADPERVQAYAATCAAVFCELQPGDALFFHCNLLHSSGRNASESPRWSIISAYNRLDNRPLGREPPSCVTPIAPLADDDVFGAPAGAPAGVAADADFLKKERRRYQEREDR